MTDHLDAIVKGAKESLNAKTNDYVTVMIVVLLGTKKDVLEAEAGIVNDFDLDDLPCQSARITLGNWKGKVKKK